MMGEKRVKGSASIGSVRSSPLFLRLYELASIPFTCFLMLSLSSLLLQMNQNEMMDEKEKERRGERCGQEDTHHLTLSHFARLHSLHSLSPLLSSHPLFSFIIS